MSSIAMPNRACRSFEQLQDLRLDGDVERGGRLVGDQEVGLVGERHRDHHALALAARELMRIGVEPALRLGNADLLQQLDDARARRARRCRPLVQEQRLGDLLLDRVQRIERGHRLLEHHGDAVAADLAQLALGGAPTSSWPLKRMLPRGMAARPDRAELQDRQRRHRLAGAGFADQRQRLALADIERDAFDRRDRVPPRVEGDGEIADRERRRGSCAHANSCADRTRRAPLRR